MKTGIGLCGATGKTPDITIGEVKQVDYNKPLKVAITGTRENPILNFEIPKGKDGAKLLIKEYFNGDITVLNSLRDLPEGVSDAHNKTVMSVNGIKELLDKINEVITEYKNADTEIKNNANTMKSEIDTSISELENRINEKITNLHDGVSPLSDDILKNKSAIGNNKGDIDKLKDDISALQSENENLKDKLLSTLIYVEKQGEEIKEDTTKAPVKNILIEGKTVVTDAPSDTNPNYKNIESACESEENKIKFDVHGKNYCNGQKFYPKGMNSNGTINTNGINNVIDFCDVKPSTEYVTSINGNTRGTNIYYYDKDKNFLYKDANTFPTFTTPSNCYYTRHAYGTSGEEPKIQIEEGTQPTPYEPFKEEKKEVSIPIENGLKSLPNGTRDEVEERTDGFYLVQRVGKVNLNGSENWALISLDSAPTSKYFYITIGDMKKGCESGITNLFGVYTHQQGVDVNNTDTYGISLYVDDSLELGNLRLRVPNEKLPTLDVQGLKTYLQETPINVYYELATPIETKISDIEIETLGGINYITTENSIKPNLNLSISKSIKSYIDEKIGGNN